MSDQFRNATKMPPAPPSRAALAAVLVQAAEGASLVASHPVSDAGGAQRIDMANGWILQFWWHPDATTCISRQLSKGLSFSMVGALAPDGGCWTWGCDRWPDWNAGPDAVALEPIRHLLTPDQREQLRQRLLSCSCWPEPDPPPEPPSMARIEELYPLEVMAS